MVVSNQTAIDIAKVVLKYVGKETARKIVKELVQVRGNRSFRDTIARVEHYLADSSTEMETIDIWDIEAWAAKSRKGEVCGIFGCPNKPTTKCKHCFNMYCDEHKEVIKLPTHQGDVLMAKPTK